jgi:outer membrane protein OmpA-like peptidoglycan-associated protein
MNKIMKTIKNFLALFMAVTILLGGTVANAQTKPRKPWSKTAKGAVIGAVGGGVAGGTIGRIAGGKKSTAKGAIIGAAVGGAAGAAIGRYMDKQAAELREDLQNARVERVGEGIKITFDSGILFKTNSAELSSTAMANIDDLSKTLQKYSDTNVLIEGHTDATGTEYYNQTLSEKRAQSVRRYTTMRGVAPDRITAQGYGESQPVADNTSVNGKQANRRVEIAIFANEKLKKAAERGQI